MARFGRPSASREEDPLLPSYDPSPEIQGTHGNSPEVRFSHSDEEQTVSVTLKPEISYGVLDRRYGAMQEQLRLKRGDGAGSDDGQPRTMEATMGKCFRAVFSVLFILVVLGIFMSALYPQPTDKTPIPWPSHRPWTPNKSVPDRAKAILDSTPLIDGHNDLAIWVREHYGNNITSERFRHDFEKGDMPLNVDLPRMRKGQVGGAFWSAFVVCPNNASYDMSTENYATAVSHTLQQIDLLQRLHAQYPKDFSSPGNTGGKARKDLLDLWHATKAFLAPISIEGLHQISPTAPMSSLREYYRLGVRMATLTWNCHNPFADASIVMNSFQTPAEVVNGVFRLKEGPVTEHGRRVLKEMNRLGMIIDLSHTSYWTQQAVLTKSRGLTRAPVVFSHSSAYSICPHPRNVRDDTLDLVRETNSLVMVNFTPDFISCTASESSVVTASDSQPCFSLPHFYEQNNTLHQVARHIKYIGERIGFEHVGLGSDFDGMGTNHPQGLSGVDKFPALVEELLKLGLTDHEAQLVVGDNILRVWEDVDEVSRQMEADGIEPELDDASGY